MSWPVVDVVEEASIFDFDFAQVTFETISP